MNSNTGFRSPEHEAAFVSASWQTRRNGANAPACGARTRTGAACQNIPIREGKGRCLRHAGPKAALEHREKTYQKFVAGKISVADWSRAEARRSANRLGWEWKRNPWVPGKTIDLGPEEARLRSDLRTRGVDADTLPPAVADWLRWRFRRTQIDRWDERAWVRSLTDGLPTRLSLAYMRSEGGNLPEIGAHARAARTWTADAAGAASKRRQNDKPRAPKVQRGKGYLRPGRPATLPASDLEMDQLMGLYREHRAIVAPMMEACPQEGDRIAVLRTLRDFVADPSNKIACESWVALVRKLRTT
jgi:hypothetical protein